MPANATAHFAFVTTGDSGAGDGSAGGELNILLAALGAKLGLGPSALPQPGREAGFALLTHRRAETQGAKASGVVGGAVRSSSPWRVHQHVGGYHFGQRHGSPQGPPGGGLCRRLAAARIRGQPLSRAGPNRRRRRGREARPKSEAVAFNT